MKIKKVTGDKKCHIELLFLADEQESMIDRYLERGEMFVMEDSCGMVIAVAVVTDEGNGIAELKNLAVSPEKQRKGYGRKMVEYICGYYSGKCVALLVGTGESPSTMGFYVSCGFVYSHRIRDFFTFNYDHPIIDGGVLLRDMVYFKKYL